MRRNVLLLLLLSLLAAGPALVAGEKPGPAELLKLGDTFFREKTWKKAIEAYEGYLAASPDETGKFHARLGIARSLLGLRQWYRALKRLGPWVEETEAGSVERAEAAHLYGAVRGQYQGGSKVVEKWLDEAERIYAAKEMREERIRTLFALAISLSRRFEYEVSYQEWEREYRPGEGKEPEVTRPKYRMERMKVADDHRYERVVAAYRKIIDLSKGKGPDAARARDLLGAFHVNVLALVFRTNPNYYGPI